MSKEKYEVRVRENPSPNKWVKKSKFYDAASPAEARSKYHGIGHIMWVEKVSKEKLWGVGEFFTLGNKLLKEFSEGGNSESLEAQIREQSKEKVRKKRAFNFNRRGL